MRILITVLLLGFLTACASTADVKQKACWHAAEQIEQEYGFCQAIRSGDTLHVSGSVGGGSMPQAIAQAYGTLKATLEAHGLTFADVVKETVYTTDMDQLIAHQQLRKAYYGDDFPASSWIGIDRLFLREFVIEVEITAVFPGD